MLFCTISLSSLSYGDQRPSAHVKIEWLVSVMICKSTLRTTLDRKSALHCWWLAVRMSLRIPTKTIPRKVLKNDRDCVGSLKTNCPPLLGILTLSIPKALILFWSGPIS